MPASFRSVSYINNAVIKWVAVVFRWFRFKNFCVVDWNTFEIFVVNGCFIAWSMQNVSNNKTCPVKNLWLIPCFFHLWSEVTRIQICASLKHRKKMKAEPSRLMPLKPGENLLELFIVNKTCCSDELFLDSTFFSAKWVRDHCPQLYSKTRFCPNNSWRRSECERSDCDVPRSLEWRLLSRSKH